MVRATSGWERGILGDSSGVMTRVLGLGQNERFCHGTTTANWVQIQKNGSISPMGRSGVQCSPCPEEAADQLGGEQTESILYIEVYAMLQQGHILMRAPHGSIAIDYVPIKFIYQLNDFKKQGGAQSDAMMNAKPPSGILYITRKAVEART